MSDALSYIRGTGISRLLGIKHYLDNYFDMDKRLTHFRIRVELASPALLRLRII